MFEDLTNNLKTAIKSLKGQDRITEINIASTIKEIRRSLINADVHYKVAKQVTDTIKQNALGQRVLFSSVSPGQLFTSLVKDELTQLMGSTNETIALGGNPSIILVMGLQGAGKTTFCGKLALHLKKKNKNVLLVGCDIYRPAACEQLKILGESIEIPVYIDPNSNNAYQIAHAAIHHAKENANQVVIVDTAGRLAIDTAMMQELINLKTKLNPSETLFVADAMTGQDAVHTAKAFNEQVNFDGVILTKLDGDARGGAALSIRIVVEKPIKLISTGEKMEDLELFHPDRIASRILGMGDVISLVERAKSIYSEEQEHKLWKKLNKNQFNLNDLVIQLHQIKKIGNLGDLINMIPGKSDFLKNISIDENVFNKFESIINSMTPKERTHPSIINKKRCERIAKGSGTSVQEVNNLLKQFDAMCKAMKQFQKGNNSELMKKFFS